MKMKISIQNSIKKLPQFTKHYRHWERLDSIDFAGVPHGHDKWSDRPTPKVCWNSQFDMKQIKR